MMNKPSELKGKQKVSTFHKSGRWTHKGVKKNLSKGKGQQVLTGIISKRGSRGLTTKQCKDLNACMPPNPIKTYRITT